MTPGPVMLSPNIKKTSHRIDTVGNIINPKTKQIVQPIEADYVPSPADLAHAMQGPQGAQQPVQLPDVVETPKNPNPLKEAIKAEVQKAVQEQIKNIDIAGMVAEAMKEAFK